jgi:hypothetical protein
MNYSMLSAAVVVALALSACEKRETVIQQPARAPSSAPAPEVVPVPVPGPQGPSGAPGAEGPKGEPGRPGGGTVVVVPPSPSDDKK